MSIIVTGFEPFGGSETNRSWEAVRALDGACVELLPVTFSGAAAAVRRIAARHPDAIICIGEAGGRSSISVERVAVNLMDARIPDNDGEQPRDLPVRPEGPAAYFSTLPTRTILQRLRDSGIAADLSYTAGTYVCNSTFYTLMDAVSVLQKPVPAGFIHIPASDMPADQIAEAVRIILETVRAFLTDPWADSLEKGRPSA